MPRKERKKKVQATKITPIVNEGGLKRTEPEINVEQENNFQKLCMDVAEVLRSEPGNKLSCRIRVLVEDRSAVIYQGLLSTVCRRLTHDGKHAIYRHALKQVLLEDPRTKHIFD